MKRLAVALVPLMVAGLAADETPPAKEQAQYARVCITSSKPGTTSGALLDLNGQDYKGIVAERLGFAGKKGEFVVLVARVRIGGPDVSIHWVVDRSEKLKPVVAEHENPTQRGKKITIEGQEYYTGYLLRQGEVKGFSAEGQLYAPARPKEQPKTPLESLVIPALFCPKEKVRLYDSSDANMPTPGLARVEGDIVAGRFHYDGDKQSGLAIRNDQHPIVLVAGNAKDIPSKGPVRATGRLRITDAGQTWLIVDEISVLGK